MEIDLPETFQMRFDLNNEQDQKIAHFLQDYPWSRTQIVKEILLAYIDTQSSEAIRKAGIDISDKKPS
jgi:hypothetical protein